MHRLSIGDAAELAGDVGPDPRLIGVLAQTSDRIDLDRFRTRVEAALVDLPVLRRQLVRHGRNPLAARWKTAECPVDQHVCAIPVHGALLRTVERLFVEGLPGNRPLWRMLVLDDGLHDHLLFMAHHVLLDGVTAVCVLRGLLDDARVHDAGLHDASRITASPPPARPRPFPVLPLGLLAGITPAASASSLCIPISSGFHLATVQFPLDPVHAAARRAGATVNDVLLAAVAASLRELAAARGERLERVVVSVPVTGQATPGAKATRNGVGAFTIAVPSQAPGETSSSHLAELARHTRRRKALVRDFPAATGGFSLLLATLGRLGLYRPLFEHQRAITTLLTNLRGPDQGLTVGGARIVSLTPVSPALGNVCVVFAVVSYAGQLNISIRLDRSVWQDQEFLVAALLNSLARLTHDAAGV